MEEHCQGKGSEEAEPTTPIHSSSIRTQLPGLPQQQGENKLSDYSRCNLCVACNPREQNWAREEIPREVGHRSEQVTWELQCLLDSNLIALDCHFPPSPAGDSPVVDVQGVSNREDTPQGPAWDLEVTGLTLITLPGSRLCPGRLDLLEASYSGLRIRSAAESCRWQDPPRGGMSDKTVRLGSPRGPSSKRQAVRSSS